MPENKIPTPLTLSLYDSLLNSFNTELIVQLHWLNYAFAEAQNLSRIEDDKTVVYPAVYGGQNIKNEYASVLPNEFMGNEKAIKGFSFFTIKNKEIESLVLSNGTIRADASIIFWFNLDKVLNNDAEFRNLNKVVLDILKAIKSSSSGLSGKLEPYAWTTEFDEIYSEYSLKETEKQYLMHPFAGVRVDCKLVAFQSCV